MGSIKKLLPHQEGAIVGFSDGYTAKHIAEDVFNNIRNYADDTNTVHLDSVEAVLAIFKHCPYGNVLYYDAGDGFYSILVSFYCDGGVFHAYCSDEDFNADLAKAVGVVNDPLAHISHFTENGTAMAFLNAAAIKYFTGLITSSFDSDGDLSHISTPLSQINFPVPSPATLHLIDNTNKNELPF